MDLFITLLFFSYQNCDFFPETIPPGLSLRPPAHLLNCAQDLTSCLKISPTLLRSVALNGKGNTNKTCYSSFIYEWIDFKCVTNILRISTTIF